MAYEPVEVKVGPEGCSDEDLVREFGEMHTGEWWHKLQVSRLFFRKKFLTEISIT
jgi:hypothetical protein